MVIDHYKKPIKIFKNRNLRTDFLIEFLSSEKVLLIRLFTQQNLRKIITFGYVLDNKNVIEQVKIHLAVLPIVIKILIFEIRAKKQEKKVDCIFRCKPNLHSNKLNSHKFLKITFQTYRSREETLKINIFFNKFNLLQQQQEK